MAKNISNNVMIVESINSQFAPVTSNTIAVPDGMLLVEGVLGVANLKNRNNRYYTLEEYQRHVEAFKKRIVEENGVFGEMEHPKSMNIDLHNVSHKVMEVWIDNSGNVKGKLLLLDTPAGKIAQSIIRSGSSLPVSSRATGSVNERTGETTLDYLSTWDLVGTSGFKQAQIKMLVNESVNEGSMIVESCVMPIGADGEVLNEDVQTLHQVDIERLVNEAVERRLQTIGSINESVNEDAIIGMLDERFKTVYAEAIQKWVAEEYSPKIQEWVIEHYTPMIADAIETWVTTEHADVIQEWITNHYTPEISEAVQKWVVEHYSPELQKWVVEEFAPEIENWVKNEYTPLISEAVQQWVTGEYTPVIAESVQKWTTSEFAPKLGEIIEGWVSGKPITTVATSAPVIEQQPSTEGAKFKSNILEHLNSRIDAAKSISKPVTESAQVDESHFQTGPAWLRLIPESFKPIWQSLNESQQDAIYKKAALRELRTKTDVDIFWKGINFNTIVESQMPAAVQRGISANINESYNPTKRIAELAKRLQ